MKWPLQQFENKSIVFVGVGQGRSMQGFEHFIRANVQIKEFIGVDKDKDAEPLAFLKNYDATNTIFVKNEAIPGHEMPVPYITPMNVFFECVKTLGAHTVGITGTKGKSTTAALTAVMIQAGGFDVKLCGNIGTSVFAFLDEATKDSVFVIELSSYQLSDIKYSPKLAVCINLYNDHADWHGSQAAYWEAKHNIIKYSDADDLFIYNPTFPELQRWAETAQCRTIALNINEPIDMNKTRLYGEHNRLNALAARLVAREFNISDETAQLALNKFDPLPHRMEYVGTFNDKIFIDDAIGMTPESTIASLRAVKDKYGAIGCVLLGGQDRGYDFTDLMLLLAELEVPNLVLFPDTVDKIRSSLPNHYSPQIQETNDMKEAVAWAESVSPAKSVVLLSTAAPSYSLWRDFQDKGDQFKQSVNNLR